jgi:hypothetical protein
MKDTLASETGHHSAGISPFPPFAPVKFLSAITHLPVEPGVFDAFAIAADYRPWSNLNICKNARNQGASGHRKPRKSVKPFVHKPRIRTKHASYSSDPSYRVSVRIFTKRLACGSHPGSGLSLATCHFSLRHI